MGDRQQPNLRLVLIDRWAQLAVERPWRYAASWVIGIGAGNLGLRMLLNDLSLARNTGMAILTVARSERRWFCPRRAEAPASRGGRPPAQPPLRRRRVVLATVAVIVITVAVLVGAVTSPLAAPEGGHDGVVPSWRD